MTEEWRPVPGYEGAYEVSDRGRVRSLPRKIEQRSKEGGAYLRSLPGVVLRPGRMPSGHLSVALGRGNSRCVHALVLLAFVGPAPAKHEVRHLDGDESNNHLSNLRYGTRSCNGRDKKWHKGAKTYKLSPADVAGIKEGIRDGASGAGAAKRYGVSESTISAIKHGVFHRDI